MKKFCVIIFLFFYSLISSAQNPGDTIFSSSNIHDINITFSQPKFWDSLMYYKQHADSFNLSTQPMMANFNIDGSPIDSVGVQLKGNSSFGFPGQKKPLKISFNQYVPGKKCEGLTVLNLNNNMLDPTMMREKLLLDFMNKKGLPAPRCTYAKVSFNGQYVGLYKMIEQVDKEFIKTHFNNWGGNLFKGDPMGTLGWQGTNPTAYYPNYELHSNQSINNWSDLLNFIDNINNTPSSDFFDTLETNLNTFPFIGQWAARNLFVDLDGYFHSPHNYYLYHNINTNKFEWCTWDVSVAFGFYPMTTEDTTENTNLLMAYNPLVIRMLADSVYKKTYLNTICDYLDYFKDTVLFPLIDSIANKIYPAFAAEPDSNQMFPEQALFYTCDTMTIHTPIGDIPGLKKFITNRRAIVLAQLNSLAWVCPLASANEISQDEKEIEIFPNPSLNGKFIVSGLGSGVQLQVYNMYGEKIYETTTVNSKQETINLSGASGIYFLQVRTAEGIMNKKIIVSK
ncbi:MAG: CotH kinase family protein [Bacteroidetes bacterium]|nr:CotH kinase family protein [Bacteroidota bacterium]